MSNPCENCRQQLIEHLPPRIADDASTHIAELPPEVQAHLAACPDCTREWQRLQNMMAALHEIPLTSAPANLRANVRSQIADQQRATDEKRAPKSTGLLAFFRPQRIAWTGSVALGGLLLVLAAQQPWPGLDSSAPNSAPASAPPAAKIERETTLEVKNAKTENRGAKPPAKTVAPRPAPSVTSPPNVTTNAENAPPSAADAIPAPVLPSGPPRPSAPALPSGSALPSAPVLPPRALPQTAKKPPTQPSSTQLKTSSERRATAAAPKNSTANPLSAPLFSDTGKNNAPKSAAKPPKVVAPTRPIPAPMANPASEAPSVTARSAPIDRAHSEDAHNEESATLATPPANAETFGAGSPPAVADAAPGASADASQGFNAYATQRGEARGDENHTARKRADATRNAGAAESENARRISLRFVPARDVKNARLRIEIPSGNDVSTQIAWTGRARAGIAIPVNITLRSTEKTVVKLVLEEKRGDKWNTVQEQKIEVASP